MHLAPSHHRETVQMLASLALLPPSYERRCEHQHSDDVGKTRWAKPKPSQHRCQANENQAKPSQANIPNKSDIPVPAEVARVSFLFQQFTKFRERGGFNALHRPRGNSEDGSESESADDSSLTKVDFDCDRESLAVYLTWLRSQKSNTGSEVSKNVMRENALLLRCEHWLEAADEKHRYGSNLRPFFDYWVENVEGGDSDDDVSNCEDIYDSSPVGCQDYADLLDDLLHDGRRHLWKDNLPAKDDITVMERTAHASIDIPNNGKMPRTISTPQLGRKGRGGWQMVLKAVAAIRTPPNTPTPSSSVLNLLSAESEESPLAEGDTPYRSEHLPSPSDSLYNLQGSRLDRISFTDDEKEVLAGELGDNVRELEKCQASEHLQLQSRVLSRKLSCHAPPPALEVSRGLEGKDDQGAGKDLGEGQGAGKDFDLGAGKDLDLGEVGVPRSKLESERVTYLTPEELEHYEVVVLLSGHVVYKLSGKPLHTYPETDKDKEKQTNDIGAGVLAVNEGQGPEQAPSSTGHADVLAVNEGQGPEQAPSSTGHADVCAVNEIQGQEPKQAPSSAGHADVRSVNEGQCPKLDPCSTGHADVRAVNESQGQGPEQAPSSAGHADVRAANEGQGPKLDPCSTGHADVRAVNEIQGQGPKQDPSSTGHDSTTQAIHAPCTCTTRLGETRPIHESTTGIGETPQPSASTAGEGETESQPESTSRGVETLHLPESITTRDETHQPPESTSTRGGETLRIAESTVRREETQQIPESTTTRGGETLWIPRSTIGRGETHKPPASTSRGGCESAMGGSAMRTAASRESVMPIQSLDSPCALGRNAPCTVSLPQIEHCSSQGRPELVEASRAFSDRPPTCGRQADSAEEEQKEREKKSGQSAIQEGAGMQTAGVSDCSLSSEGQAGSAEGEEEEEGLGLSKCMSSGALERPCSVSCLVGNGEVESGLPCSTSSHNGNGEVKGGLPCSVSCHGGNGEVEGGLPGSVSCLGGNGDVESGLPFSTSSHDGNGEVEGGLPCSVSCLGSNGEVEGGLPCSTSSHGGDGEVEGGLPVARNDEVPWVSSFAAAHKEEGEVGSGQTSGKQGVAWGSGYESASRGCESASRDCESASRGCNSASRGCDSASRGRDSASSGRERTQRARDATGEHAADRGGKDTAMGRGSTLSETAENAAQAVRHTSETTVARVCEATSHRLDVARDTVNSTTQAMRHSAETAVAGVTACESNAASSLAMDVTNTFMPDEQRRGAVAAGGGGGGHTPPPSPSGEREEHAEAARERVKEKARRDKWIYVVDTDCRIYVAKKVRGQFHHSSFLRGAAVLAAGGMQCEHGKLMKLNADSGHYWPKPEHFEWFYDHLESLGADVSVLHGMEFKTKH
eukprot:gene31510-6694_t